MAEAINYKEDISVCPRCKNVPQIQYGTCKIMTTDIDINTFYICCCGIDSLTWIAKSPCILHWNLKAMSSYYKTWQMEFDF